MPSSSVRTFTDPDQYAASIRQGTYELTVIGRGDFTAKLTRIDLHRVWMQRFSEALPRISHVSGWGGRAVIAFRTRPGPSLLRVGMEMQPTTVVRHSEGQGYYQNSSGLASYGSMSLPVEEMASFGVAVAGCDLAPPKDALALTPPAFALAKLRELHEAAGQLAEHAPTVLAHSEAARGLEQALIGAMIDCLSGGNATDDRAALRKHALIMRRFHTVVEEHLDQTLFLPELCRAIGVSGRNLQVCCREQLGISPKRYLLLRRMNLARRALRESAPLATTVTEIATRFGFWQLGSVEIHRELMTAAARWIMALKL